MRPTRHLIAASALAIVMTALTACDSSDGSTATSSDNADNTASSATQPTGEPIPIGTIGSYTGSFPRLVGGSKSGVTAWVESVNAAGGINGRPVKLYAVDDHGSASTALAAAKKMVNEDHVVAIVGQQSQNGAPWIPWVVEQGVPVIGGNTYDTPAFTQPGYFNVGGNLIATFYGLTALASENGSKLGALYCAESPACAATPALLEALGADEGLSVPYSNSVSQTAPDYTSQCQGLKSSGAESYTLGMAQTAFQKVVNQCIQQGYKGKVILPDTADDTLADDPAFNGTQIVSSLIPAFVDSTPATKAFHEALAKYAPEVGGDTIGLDEPVVGGWVSGKLFEAAVQASGSTDITSDTLLKGLYSLKDETLGGMTMPLTFTKGKPSVGNCYFSYEIQDGELTTPNGLEPECVDPAVLSKALAALSE